MTDTGDGGHPGTGVPTVNPPVAYGDSPLYTRGPLGGSNLDHGASHTTIVHDPLSIVHFEAGRAIDDRPYNGVEGVLTDIGSEGHGFA